MKAKKRACPAALPYAYLHFPLPARHDLHSAHSPPPSPFPSTSPPLPPQLLHHALPSTALPNPIPSHSSSSTLLSCCVQGPHKAFAAIKYCACARAHPQHSWKLPRHKQRQANEGPPDTEPSSPQRPQQLRHWKVTWETLMVVQRTDHTHASCEMTHSYYAPD